MKHRGRLKNSMLADEADNPGFMLLLEQAEHELIAGHAEIATFYLDKYLSTLDYISLYFYSNFTELPSYTQIMSQ